MSHILYRGMNSVFVDVTVSSRDAGAEPTWMYSRRVTAMNTGSMPRPIHTDQGSLRVPSGDIGIAQHDHDRCIGKLFLDGMSDIIHALLYFSHARVFFVT